MNIEQQLIFLFSAIGGFNGLALSGYFLIFKSGRRRSDLFLGALLFMMSVRVVKSVFLNFNPDLFQLFAQIGLSACLYIGPFFYLYIFNATGERKRLGNTWWVYLLPFVAFNTFILIKYPYYGPYNSWAPLLEVFYKVWLFSIVASTYHFWPTLKKIRKSKLLTSEEVWQLNIYFGTFLVYLAFDTAAYTAYIVGAISFSFLFYVLFLLWFFNKNKKAIATDKPIKYANSALSESKAKDLVDKVTALMNEEKLHLDPDLTIDKLAERLDVTSKNISQSINQVLEKNYARFVAEYRVASAKSMLKNPKFEHYKIASIAYESGFNSLSAFNATFKNHTGLTPLNFQKSTLPDS